MQHNFEVKKEFSLTEKKQRLHRELQYLLDKNFSAKKKEGEPHFFLPHKLNLLFEEIKFCIEKWDEYIDSSPDERDLEIMFNSAALIHILLFNFNEYTLYEGNLTEYRPNVFWQEHFQKIPGIVELQPYHAVVSPENLAIISDNIKEHSKKLKSFFDRYSAGQKNTFLLEEIRREIHALKDSTPIFMQRHFFEKEEKVDENDGGNDAHARKNIWEELVDNTIIWLMSLTLPSLSKNRYENWKKTGQKRSDFTESIKKYKKHVYKTKIAARKIFHWYGPITEQKCHTNPKLADKIKILMNYFFSDDPVISEMKEIFKEFSTERFNILREKIDLSKEKFLRLTESNFLPESTILLLAKEKNTLNLFKKSVNFLEIATVLEKYPLLVRSCQPDFSEAKNALINILSMTTEEHQKKNANFFITHEKTQYIHQKRLREKGINKFSYFSMEHLLWSDKEISQKIFDLKDEIENIILNSHEDIEKSNSDMALLFQKKSDKLTSLFSEDILNLEQAETIIMELAQLIQNLPSLDIADPSSEGFSPYSSQILGPLSAEEPAGATNASIAPSAAEENDSLWDTSLPFWEVECVSDEKSDEPAISCLKKPSTGAFYRDKKHVRWEDGEDPQFWEDISTKGHFIL